MNTKTAVSPREVKRQERLARNKRHWKMRGKTWQLYVLMILPILYLVIFKYYPMLGAQIAFKNYVLTKGIWGSPWVGFKHFGRFIQSYQFIRVLRNTLFLSVYQLVAGFPLPIILALSLNYLKNERYRKTVQMITYAPHFISTVVIVGMIMQFLSPRYGVISSLYRIFDAQAPMLLGSPGAFPSIYVWSGIWQNVGYGSIIYIATLSGVDPSQHEAAVVDGASIMQRIYHVDIPAIMPTAVILLIMRTGQILNVGFEKVLLMQNPLNMRAAEVIATYVYKTGLASPIPQFSYAAAIGLFQSIIGLGLMISVNRLSRKVSESSLW